MEFQLDLSKDERTPEQKARAEIESLEYDNTLYNIGINNPSHTPERKEDWMFKIRANDLRIMELCERVRKESNG